MPIDLEVQKSARLYTLNLMAYSPALRVSSLTIQLGYIFISDRTVKQQK